MSIQDPYAFLRSLYDEAVAAAQPKLCVPNHMPEPPKEGRVFVIGAGKASAQMAQAFEESWQHHKTHPLTGIVITRYGYGCECKNIKILEASHPVPDHAGLQATEDLISFIQNVELTDKDLVVCLISGGGSALLIKPVQCLSLEEKADINTALLRSGAPIQDMNVIRKRMSLIKGGGLARLCQPASLHTLVVSDVAGDDLESIASAPTLITDKTNKDALELIEKYSIPVPDALHDYLKLESEQLPQDIKQDIRIIASAQKSLEAAASKAKEYGIDVHILSDALEGESGECAKWHMEQLLNAKPGSLLLSGGETTVKVRGSGRGGNNGQFALEALNLIKENNSVFGLAADTDGIDGSEDNAGAYFTLELYQKAVERGLDINSYIENNDSYSFFKAINGLLMTGPTQTNVNDFRAIYLAA